MKPLAEAGGFIFLILGVYKFSELYYIIDMNMNELEIKIKNAQESYYNGVPTMSDIEFDTLWDELKNNYPDSELLKEVGEDNVDGFPKGKHSIIMGSQNKANTADEMDKFFHENGNQYIAQLKLDGSSINLEYTNGKLTRAITRGDGYEGSVITTNVIKMSGVVQQLKDNFTGSVRGEVLLFKETKDKFYSDKKNCRNAAAGIMKHLDGSGCEHLTVMVYDAQYLDKTMQFNTQTYLQDWLKDQGFKVAPYSTCTNPTGKSAIDMIDSTIAENNAREFDIDGIVWKKNQIDMDDFNNNLRPKSNIALKPKYTLAKSVITDIRWSLKNGTLTPVAQVKPVELCGTTVTQASLANIRCMEDLGIEIGHEVTITKAGEIIPKILSDLTTGKSVEGYVF